MFEYAIGHWLQKATEHMMGCVLCRFNFKFHFYKIKLIIIILAQVAFHYFEPRL